MSYGPYYDWVIVDHVVMPEEVKAMDQWRMTHFGEDAEDPAVAGVDADPELDGISNLMEYATGSDPNGHSVPVPLVVNREGVVDTLIHPRNRTANDLIWTMEQSTNLEDWIPIAFSEQVISSVDELDTVEARVTAPGNDTIFYRMRLSERR